jgi:hypothetical protein
MRHGENENGQRKKPSCENQADCSMALL